MNRRSFLNIFNTAAGSLLLSNLNFAKPMFEKKRLSKIGVQLYTVRKALESDFEGTLGKIAALGFNEVEFAGYYNHTPKQVKDILAKYNLYAPSAHISVSVLRNNLQETIDAAKTIGHKYVVIGYLSAEERQSLDDYKKHIELFNKAGEQFKKAGIQLGYHNHDFEFVIMNGKRPYDLILAETDARLVKMELDLYWITKAEQNPLSYFEKYPGRFPLVHVKDMDATPKRFFTEVGRGVIDFKKIFANADKAGIKHYFVEQDETSGAPFESIKISLNYLKQLEY